MKHPKSAEKACPKSEPQPENLNPKQPNPKPQSNGLDESGSGPGNAPKSESRARLRSEAASARQSSTNGGVGGSFARHGKIARLPVEVRDALNRRLVRGVSGPELLEWLNALPETQAVLHQFFDGQPISPQNLSQWRRGGFRDWLNKEEAKEVFCEFAIHHRNLDALELNEKVALWLGTRLVAMTGCVDRQSPEESWPVVREMVRDVSALRRGDHRIREQRFKEKARQKITDQEHLDWAMEPGRLEWLCKYAGEYGNDAKTEILGEFMFREHWRKMPKAPGTSPDAQKPETQPPPSPGGSDAASHAPKAEKAQSEQATSTEIKVNQTKSKCVAEGGNGGPAAEKTEPGTGTSTKQAVPTPGGEGKGGQSPLDKPQVTADSAEPAGQPGDATAPVQGQSQVPCEARAFPKRPQYCIDLCYCGAKNEISLADCKPCSTKWSQGMPICPCH